MEKVQLAIGRLLLAGILFSSLIVIVGASLYLFSHGSDSIHYQDFQGEPTTLRSIRDIFHEAFSSSLGLIQLGLLILVIVQLLRVALTGFYFIKLRDKSFSLISFFILGVLIYSLMLEQQP